MTTPTDDPQFVFLTDQLHAEVTRKLDGLIEAARKDVALNHLGPERVLYGTYRNITDYCHPDWTPLLLAAAVAKLATQEMK